ncbi:hypothetical protein [Micromonospora sp. NPDC005203]|uniref:hypothetical protein n=1 Tax=Micromonospora sp. NPDC005203 TaxID=3364226 RepID=UPI0036C28C35
MSYRRRGYRNGSRQQDGYLRTLRYEAPKEGIGKLVEKLSEWGGAVLGLAAATAVAKQGVSVPPTVLAGSGLVLGAASGAAAKAMVTAGFDTLRERRSGRRLRNPTGSGSVSVGGVATEIEQVIASIEGTHQVLLGAMDRISNNSAWLMTVLAGASPSVLQQVGGQLTGARRSVQEACTLLRLSKDNLRGYLRSI